MNKVTYRMYYSDGNRRILEGKSLTQILSYLTCTDEQVETIYKIEKIDDDEAKNLN